MEGCTTAIGGIEPPGGRRKVSWTDWTLAIILASTWLGVTVAAPSAGQTPLTTVRVASGLSSPVFVTHAPGDFARMFIVEQCGRIRVLKNGVLLPDPFLDVDPLTTCLNERGLLGLAFHPNYADNGFFYINFTNNLGNTVVARYQVSADPDVASGASGRVVLTYAQPFANHNGGWLGFGPDGYLYVSSGDGGSQMDPNGRGQDITSNLLGKILRIDVDGDDWPEDDLKNYAIPLDNPFVGVDGDDEIWAYGLRNPWRCAFDTATGDFYIADVGERHWEEVNVQPASSGGGENYGWNCLEGHECTTFGECDCQAGPFVPPVHTYSHDGNGGIDPCSISGGEVYRGCAIPDLAGTYFFADFCSDQIWSFRGTTGPADVTERTAELAPGGVLGIGSISSFGRDAAGELYICDLFGGEVFKIVPAAPTGSLSIVGSDPPSGAIDARQPSAPDGSQPAGWSALAISFDGCVDALNTQSFSVAQDGVEGPAPTVLGVVPIAPDCVRVEFDRLISPRAWTIITHIDSGTFVRLGFLPGDVNGDARSTPQDVLAMIDALNGVGATRPEWSTDIDRSGLSAPQDVLRTIDLLNGADMFESYLGATLP